MAKKCIICSKEAEFCIKDSSECYCKDCAEEHFGDINMLVKIEEEAQRLKMAVEERMSGQENEFEEEPEA